MYSIQEFVHVEITFRDFLAPSLGNPLRRMWGPRHHSPYVIKSTRQSSRPISCDEIWERFRKRICREEKLAVALHRCRIDCLRLTQEQS